MVALVESMERIWVKSQWTKKELDNQTVQFRIPTEHGKVSGIGQFWVHESPDGRLSIDIVVDVAKTWGEREQYRFHIPQIGADAIEKQPDPSLAAFRLG